MVDLKPSPKEIFEKRESLGLNNSINMLAEIIETNKDNDVRKEAISFLGNICRNSATLKKEGFEILENVLVSDDNNDIKCQTAKTLGKMKYEKALKPLKWIIKQEFTDSEVRMAALIAIANIRFTESEIELFIEQLNSDNKKIKEVIKNKLITLSPVVLIKQLIEGLQKDNYYENHKNEIIELIGLELSSLNVSFEDVSFLEVKYPEILTELKNNKIKLLETIIPNLKEKNPKLLENILIILNILGEDIHKDLISFLENDDFIIKKNAIKLIGKLHIKEGVKALLKNLDNIYEDVNKATIEALGEIGDITVVPELLNILDIEDVNYEYIDLDMKWFVLDAITKIYLSNKDASFDYLFIHLDSNNNILKENIAYLFGEIGYEEFVDLLIKLLKEKNLDVRKNASIALGKIGKKNAVDALIEIVNNDNYWILKKVAIDAVFNIYIKNFYVEASKELSDSHREFIKNIEKLINYLNNTNDHCKVKLSVIKLLEVFGSKTAINALMKQVNDFHRIVRIASSKAIKKIEKRLEKKEEEN